jgi:hypothetical protein
MRDNPDTGMGLAGFVVGQIGCKDSDSSAGVEFDVVTLVPEGKGGRKASEDRVRFGPEDGGDDASAVTAGASTDEASIVACFLGPVVPDTSVEGDDALACVGKGNEGLLEGIASEVAGVGAQDKDIGLREEGDGVIDGARADDLTGAALAQGGTVGTEEESWEIMGGACADEEDADDAGLARTKVRGRRGGRGWDARGGSGTGRRLGLEGDRSGGGDDGVVGTT